MLTPEQIKEINNKAGIRSSAGTAEDRINRYRQIVQEKSEPVREARGDGFFKGLAKGIAQPFVKLGVTGYVGAAGLYNLARGEYGKVEKLLDGVEVPGFGNVTPLDVKNKPLEAVGTTLETASNFVGGGIYKNIIKTSGKNILRNITKEGIKRGAIVGGTSGLGISLQKEDPNLKDVAIDIGIGIATGAVLEGLLARRFEGAAIANTQKAANLRQEAVEYYQKGLKATRDKYKEKADQVIPELLDRGWWGTRKGLLEKAEKGIELNKLEYEQLGELKGVADISGLVTKIDDKLSSYLRPDGQILSINKTRYNALLETKNDILSYRLYDEMTDNPTVYQQQLRELAEAYGKDLYGTRKAIKTVKDNKAQSQIQFVDSAIRDLLAKNNPEYAAINKVFVANNRLKEILDETAKRKAPHGWISLKDMVLGTIGGVAGIGGGLKSVLNGSALLIAFHKIIDSTWFNTMRAVQKNRLAEKLMEKSASERNELLIMLSNEGIRAVNIILSEE